MANLHEWRKRAALHTQRHGGVPAEFMRASFACSKQLLSATALWETLCMKLEGQGKVANQWLRQVALKLLDVLQIEQLANPNLMRCSGERSHFHVAALFPHTLWFIHSSFSVESKCKHLCSTSHKFALCQHELSYLCCFFHDVALLTADVRNPLH